MADDMPPPVVDLLHCLGFAYLRHGQPYRAVVLLIVAAQAATTRQDVLRTLAGALVAARLGEQAIGVLDRLAALAPEQATHPMLRLLRARALLLLGRREDARSVFRAPDAPAGPPQTAAAPGAAPRRAA